jgi:hypothetical protein
LLDVNQIDLGAGVAEVLQNWNARSLRLTGTQTQDSIRIAGFKKKAKDGLAVWPKLRQRTSSVPSPNIQRNLL